MKEFFCGWRCVACFARQKYVMDGELPAETEAMRRQRDDDADSHANFCVGGRGSIRIEGLSWIEK